MRGTSVLTRAAAGAAAALLGVASFATPAAATAPSAPKIGASTAGNGDGLMTLKWSAPLSDGGSPITSYRYDVSTDGGATYGATAYLSGPFTLRATGVLCARVSTGCTFRVYAVNADGIGTASAPKLVKWAVPGKPLNLVANAGPAAAEAQLTFAAPATDGGYAIDHYQYQWSLDGVAWVNGATTIAGPTRVAWGCGAQATCSFRVRAHNALGYGAFAAVSTAAFGAPRAVQSLNTTVDSVALGDGVAVVDMHWSEPDTNGAAIDRYEVQTCAGFGGCGPTNVYWDTATVTAIGNTLTYAPTCPAAVETCAFRIRAHNAYGSGPWRHKFLTPYAPFAPAAATGTGSGNVALSWTANRGPMPQRGAYRVYVCATGGACSADGDWTDTGLTPGTATTAVHHCGWATNCKYRITFVYDQTGMPANSGEESTFSAQVSADAASEPAEPINLVASSSTTTTGAVNLTWTAPSYTGTSALTGFVVQRDAGSGYATIASPGASAASIADTGCGADVTCTYRIAAVNAVGTSTWSTTASAIGANVPGAPQGLSATPGTTSGAVDLAWSIPTTTGGHPVTSYRVERAVGAGAFALLQTVSGSTLALTDTTCGASVSCSYRVRAANTMGSGAWSSTATSTGADVPTAPTSPSATTNSTTSGAVDVAWSAPTSNGGRAVTGYVVQRNSGSGFVAATSVGATTTTWTDTACGALTSCSYRVAATNVVGQGAWSATATATGASVPSAPQSPAAIPGTVLGAVDVSWSAPANAGTQPVTSYVVQRDSGSGFSTVATPSGTTQTDTGCGAAVTCTYRVAAVNSVGQSPWSTSVQSLGADVPDAPTAVSASSSSTTLGAVDLSWTAPSNNGGRAVTSYVVQRDNGSGYATIATPSGITTTDTACGANVSCTYRVAAVTVIGQGTWSTTSTALGASLASAVRSLTATTGTSLGAVDLLWLAPTTSGTASITSYRIERQIGAGTFTLLATVGSGVTTATDSSCGANVSCSYRVAAITSVGIGAYSLTSTATGADVLSAPQSLTASRGTSIGAVDLSWSAPLSDGGNALQHYQVERDAGSGFTLIATLGPSTTSYSDTGCGAFVDCTYRVRGDNAVGNGPYSSTASARGASTPSAPTLTATTSASALTYVALSWTVPSDNGGYAITGYEYRVDTGSGYGAWTATGSTAVSLAYACNTGADRDHTATSCTVQVRGVNSLGSGSASNASTATGLVDNAVPSPTVNAPAAWFTTSTPTITGTATTALGDQAATVTVSFYSGSACSGTAVRTVVADGSSGTWSATPSATLGADGTYSVCATETDWTQFATTNSTTTSPRSFGVDTTAPSATITAPTSVVYDSAGVYDSTWSGSITGTASDATSGVASVQYSMRQSSTGNYWNGSSFASASEVLLSATGTTSWSASFAAANFPAGGSYVVRSVPTDTAGNVGAGTSTTFYIDENPSDTVYVASTGSDANNGTSTSTPLATVDKALQVAKTSSRSRIVVGAGSFGAVAMTGANYTSGKLVRGGFSASTWKRVPGSNTSTMTGAGTAVLVDGFTVTFQTVSIAATNTGLSAGSSVYGLRAINSANVTLNKTTITSAAGVAGSAGTNASASAASGGAAGGNGQTGCDHCGTTGGSGGSTQTAAGAGGSNSGRAAGGSGGSGSTASGGGAGGAGGGGGCLGYYGGCKGTKGFGGGAGTKGTAGAAGAASDTAYSTTFTNTTGNGGNGGNGTNGGGGGGGGAGGGGCDGSFCVGNWLSGGSGGGGGGGGAGGSGGGAGTGGGGSFGVYSYNSTVTIDACASGCTTITTAAGGSGGAGGSGQTGGSGGSSGSGGAGNCTGGCANGSRAGASAVSGGAANTAGSNGNDGLDGAGCCNGTGGSGASGGGGGGGGSGAGGGGGAGGPSVGTVAKGTGSVTALNVAQVTLGAAGSGGAGGTAGTGGNNGTAGGSGVAVAQKTVA